MKLQAPVLNITLNDGFQEQHDKLERKNYGEHLKNIFSLTNEPLVVILDAPWGEGKTTFIKMWQGLLLQNPAIQSVYIDAFQSDYLDNPFVAIASAINAFGIEKEVLKEKNKFREKAVSVGWKATKLGAKLAIKAGTLGILKKEDFEDFSQLKDMIVKGSEELASSILDEEMGNFKEREDTITAFKKELSKIAKDVSPGADKPLLVIVDELDRCKPTYAVELLETIKHLFHTERVTFILAMNKRQLVRSITNVYGCNEEEGREYLEKFVNFEAKLPKVENQVSGNGCKRYIDYLYDYFGIESLEPKKEFKPLINSLCKSNNLSLRQIEKVFTNICIFYITCKDTYGERLNNSSEGPHIYIIVALSVLKVIDPDYLKKLCNSKIDLPEFKNKLNLNRCKVDNEGNDCHLLENIYSFFEVLANLDNLEKFQNKQVLSNFVEDIKNYSRIEGRYILPKYYEFINIIK